jgi:hypothetical protein
LLGQFRAHVAAVKLRKHRLNAGLFYILNHAVDIVACRSCGAAFLGMRAISGRSPSLSKKLKHKNVRLFG